jgi:hypothetical protein
VSDGLLRWTPEAPAELAGAHVVQWPRWRSDTRSERRSLDPPARARIERLLGHEAVAVLGVRLESLADLRCLHDTLLMPVLRAGVPLLVECAQRPEALDPARFVEAGFEHPHTLERMLWLCERARAGDTRHAPARGVSPHRPLDATQLAAARAPGGVVQVFAPAGSGKTTVLIERVRELLARGAAPERVLCMTFNHAAAVELRERLALAGVHGVAAQTFHTVGNRIIRRHGLVDGRTLQPEWTVPQWARFARMAAADIGCPAPEAAELPNELSTIRLGRLMTAAEWADACPDDDRSRCIARVYALVEDEKERRGLYDFDDMIVLAVRLLRGDQRARERWQAAFEHVLVDEYQDIEPAQELLVRMLAAPHDELFVVGDEDQTLYGWRRASVHRMLDLDAAYPALHRVALEHNYRCTPEVIAASAMLIAHNRLRFAKPIKPPADRPPGGARDPPRELRRGRRGRPAARPQARGAHAHGHRRARPHDQRAAAVCARGRRCRRADLGTGRALRRRGRAGDARGLLRGAQRATARDRVRRARDPAAPLARAGPGRGRADLPRAGRRRVAAGGGRAPARGALARGQGGGCVLRPRSDQERRGADRAAARRRPRPALHRGRPRLRAPGPRRPDRARRRRARSRRQDRARVRREAGRP